MVLTPLLSKEANSSPLLSKEGQGWLVLGILRKSLLLKKFIHTMKKTIFIDIAELVVLLTLPMLSSVLSFVYIILALVIIFLSKYLRKEKWQDYGFKSVNFRNILLASAIGIAFAMVDNYLLEPLVNMITGEAPDLSSFDEVEGNLANFLILLAIGWAVGGFFEEFLFRGYLLNRFSTLFSGSSAGRWVGVIAVSISFAFAHSYQDFGGIISAFYISLFFGWLYYMFGKNVWYLMLVHAFYDTVGIVYLYLGMD